MDDRLQCERCKDWERMGLSRYCPSCDAVWLETVSVQRPEITVRSQTESEQTAGETGYKHE